MREHCSHARYIWNLAWNLHHFGTLETYGEGSRRVDRDGNEYIYQKRRPVRPLPSYVEQARMLTEARAEYPWLAAGAQNVQQQALRDFSQAMRNFYAGTHASCGFTCNADINASINIAAGHAGGTPVGVREPQLVAS